MATYLVTGATGFVGGALMERLLERDGSEIHALVREGSQSRLAARMRTWPQGERVIPLVGDLASSDLGLSAAQLERLSGRVDHVVHLGALYDMTADDATNHMINVEGTRHVVAVANRIGARCLHHVSSVAVAGEYRGRFTEAMFDEAQHLPSPYHRTKFEAERIVRQEALVPWRVYRPAIVVGHSESGAMDKIDGPYYLFETIRRLATLPAWLRIVGPDLGATNIVPVDFVAAAMDYLVHAPGLDGRAFHLVSPRPQPVVSVFNAFARAAGAPRVIPAINRRFQAPVRTAGALAARLPGVELARDLVLDQVGIPPEVIPHLSFTPAFDATATQEALAGSGIEVPELRRYATALWKYWEERLDPDRARRSRPGGPLAGRRVVITGASSGIGRASAIEVARAGGVPLLVARRTDALEEVKETIEREGGQAWVYSCDITQAESVETLVKRLLADHEGIDMLVNNAGRSIRRSVRLSTDRFHDYERTMALNYFGAVRLVLELLPHMRERRFGHVVNVSSIGVQANPPRFSAYVASKAALDAFSRVVASETFGDGITFTTIHMPLVRTPMIAPTRLYDVFPTITPEDAAGMVMRALLERPKTVSTRLGTTAEVLYSLAPRSVDRVLHVAYRVFPDSAAARGDADRDDADHEESPLSSGAQAIMRLLPGVHW